MSTFVMLEGNLIEKQCRDYVNTAFLETAIFVL